MFEIADCVPEWLVFVVLLQPVFFVHEVQHQSQALGWKEGIENVRQGGLK